MERKNKQESRLPIFHERFRQLMDNQDDTQFASFLGITRQSVGNYKNGNRVPGALELIKIATKCNVSIDWLLGITKAPERCPSAADELGLSIENIAYLKEPCSPTIDKERREEWGNLIHSFVNRMIEICYKERADNVYWIMQQAISRISNGWIYDGNDDDDFEAIDERATNIGVFTLAAGSAAKYYARDIGDKLTQYLIETEINTVYQECFEQLASDSE